MMLYPESYLDHALLLAVFALAVYAFSQCQALYSNIGSAKSTGFVYIVIPFHIFGAPWLLTQSLLLPLVRLLPNAWTERWLPILSFAQTSWHDGYSTFQRIGSDTFIVVSPSQNILITCEPEAVNHILRSNAFDKPAQLMGILNIFGSTMTGTENRESRQYRKVATPFFNEDTMRKVWERGTAGGGAAMKVLTAGHKFADIGTVRRTFARLSLWLVNVVCFESKQDCIAELQGQSPLPPRHTLRYSQAMHAMVDHFKIIYAIPQALLNLSPLKVHHQSSTTFTELGSYLRELRDEKKQDLQGRKAISDTSLLDLIVQAGESTPSTISQPAILGNLFIFMFAGHEANTNTLFFVVLLLACYPSIQRALQQDIDTAIEEAASTEHGKLYDDVYAILAENMVGAVVNEALRLAPVLPFLPKIVPQKSPQTLQIAGHNHVVPGNTLVFVNTSATHQNPKYWPLSSRDHPDRHRSNPVAAFNPQHWLSSPSATKTSSDQPFGFLRPTPGSFVPFSDGSRGCLGKKFALVELYAVIVSIFREYSVELAVESHRSGMSTDDQMAEWQKARDNAEQQLSAGVEFDMSLRFKGDLPIAFVKRGEERFMDL